LLFNMLVFQCILKYRPGYVKQTMQEAYKAIADPTRRRILKYLRGGERTAGDLAEHAGVGRTALSHHLTVLKLADLVRVERRGQYQVYSLNTTVFQDLLTEILGWLGGMDGDAALDTSNEHTRDHASDA
jgi:ArsR family transcriptional regulator